MSKSRNIIIFVLVLVASALGYLWFIKLPFFLNFIIWSQENVVVYFVVLVFMKVLAIVWPPIPGGLLTLGSIPIIGWFHSALADSLGGIIGSSIAYFLGRKYGLVFIRKLFDEPVVGKINEMKIKSGKETEAVFVLRTVYNTISEIVSYGSGLFKVPFKNFFLGSVLSYLINFPLFYFVGGVINSQNIILTVIVVVAAVLLFFKLKGRYFE